LTKGKRRLCDGSFITCSVVGVLCVVFLAYRGERADRAQLVLSPAVSFAFASTVKDEWALLGEWLPVNIPMSLNVDFENVGTGPALNFSYAGRVYLEPDLSRSSIYDAESRFRGWFKLQPQLGTGTVEKNERGSVTFTGDTVSPEDYDNVKNGRHILYEVGMFWFSDDFGEHHQNFCYSVQPARPGGSVIFVVCRDSSLGTN